MIKLQNWALTPLLVNSCWPGVERSKLTARAGRMVEATVLSSILAFTMATTCALVRAYYASASLRLAGEVSGAQGLATAADAAF
jgi:hypothetical protein